MKTPAVGRASGFTLLELLVVIAIIAVLAGAGFTAGSSAIQRAKRMTAMVSCRALETAVNNYFTEYGSMPVDDGSEDTELQTDSADGVALLKVLLGSDTDLNTRGITFLNVKEGKSDKDGLIYDGNDKTTVEGLYDPWGGPYYVMLDLDYDEIVKPETAAGSSSTLNGRRVAVWTNGADGVDGTSGSTTDDVKTW